MGRSVRVPSGTKQVVIQKRIDEVMYEEFDKMISQSSKDPLLKLIRDNKIDSMSLEDIRKHLKEKRNE
jgi:hypothetical protein